MRYWEVGNELYGRWQMGWTTPAGYADRFRQFARAMRSADPSIEILACGSEGEWNERLLAEDASLFNTITHHLLVGARVSAETDPLDVFRDFMAVPVVYGEKYRELRDSMLNGGIDNPHLAITELQLFARVDGSSKGRLGRDNLVAPLYDTLIYHTAVRLLPFINIITPTGTVNHGGALRKERERVYANPCHYAQALFSAFCDAEAVPVGLSCAECTAPGVLHCTPRGTSAPIIDALAGLRTDGILLLSLVNRSTRRINELEIIFEGLSTPLEAELWRLTADVPWAGNSLDHPELIKPQMKKLSLNAQTLRVQLPPFCLLHPRFRTEQTRSR